MRKIISIFLAFLFFQCSALAQSCYTSTIMDPIPFQGNGQETVTLMDGTKWKLTSYSYAYLTEYYPAATICPSTGKLTVGSHTFDVMPVATQTTSYTFRICNQSNINVSAAYGRLDATSSTFMSHGWYNLAAGACANVSVTSSRYRYFYVYAISANDALVWQGTSGNKFCVDMSRSFDTVVDNCATRGYVEKSFIEVDTGASGTLFTHNLTGTYTAPPAALSDEDRLFNWAERTYPQMFTPATPPTQSITGFKYRAYAGGNYLAVSTDAAPHVYYLGPALNNGQLLDLGPLSSWLPRVTTP